MCSLILIFIFLLSLLVNSSDGVDLLYSNAALHWSHDHSNLFPHLVQQLRADGGVLAVQMPNNFREPSHTCMRRALEEGAFFDPDELDAVWANQPDVHEQGASHYWHLLAPHCRHVDAWQVGGTHALAVESGVALSGRA